MDYYKKTIIAVDTSDIPGIRSILDATSDRIEIYKLGYQALYATDFSAINIFKDAGKKIFLDLKLADIPNTNRMGLKAICENHTFDYYTVHIMTGELSLKTLAALSGRLESEYGKSPVPVGVTVLTSIDAPDLENMFEVKISTEKAVLNLIRMGLKDGIDHFVCSAREASKIKSVFPDAKLITPGIRPAGRTKDDQKRTMTPIEAFENGSDYIVVGRPVTAAQDMRAALDSLF